MVITLDPYIASFTEGLTFHDIPEATTLKDGLVVLAKRYPLLLTEFQSIDSQLFRRVLIQVDGEFIKDVDSAETPVSAATQVVVTFLPSGEGDVVRYVVAAALIVVGVVIGIVVGWTGIGATIAGYMISMGVSMAISTAVMPLLFTKNSPTSPMQKSLLYNSATYTFDGVKNTTASGTPISVVYGTHRMGGHVLNMYLRTTTT